MVNDYYNGLRVTMEQVVAPLRGFSQPPRGTPPAEKQFIADASHDLKTPVSVILANNAILLENTLKYEPAGGRVHLTLTQDKRRVRLSV